MTRHDGPVGRSWLALRWAVGGAATVLLASCLGLALLAQLGLTALGTAAWKRGDPLAAEQAFSRGLAVNLVDRWVLPFDRGVARFSQRSWSGAAEDFELAASLAPPEQQCIVRLNWAWALEAAGDEFDRAGDARNAVGYWQAATRVLTEANCADAAQSPEDGTDEADANPSGSPSEQLAATAERLAAKTGDGRQETEAVEADPASRLQELEALERLAREADQAGRDESGAAAEPPSDGTRSW